MAKIFSAVADAAEWIARQTGIQFIIHYLDDFLIIGAPASDECQKALICVKSIFGELGLPLVIEKVEVPATRIVFQGFELDSQDMHVRLPVNKLREIQILIKSRVGRKTCVKKEMESLAGKLANAARVVEAGKNFHA